MLINGPYPVPPEKKRQWFNFEIMPEPGISEPPEEEEGEDDDEPMTGPVCVIRIYEAIGGWMGIGAEEFVEHLDRVECPRINLHINSPGGDVFDGITISNALKSHHAKVTAYIDGLAASISSVIPIRGADKVIISDSAHMMIHNPFAMAMGDANEMRKMADTLDDVRQTIANNYVAKTGGDLGQILQMMDDETWFNAQAALDLGLADEIQDFSPSPSNKFDFSAFNYKNVPNTVKNSEPEPAEKIKSFIGGGPVLTPETPDDNDVGVAITEVNDDWKILASARQRKLDLAEYEI